MHPDLAFHDRGQLQSPPKQHHTISPLANRRSTFTHIVNKLDPKGVYRSRFSQINCCGSQGLATSASAIPPGGADLGFFLGLPMRYSALLDVKRLDDILPSFEIDVKDCLVFGDVLILDLFSRPRFGCICN